MNRLTVSLLVFSIFALAACTKKVYDSDTCDELSMMAYKGYPNQSREFKDNCAGIEIKYTQALCQKALNDLMAGNSVASLKEAYGEKIDNCLTENDLKNFSR